MPSYLLEDTAKVERPASGVRRILSTLVRLLLSWEYFGYYSEPSLTSFEQYIHQALVAAIVTSKAIERNPSMRAQLLRHKRLPDSKREDAEFQPTKDTQNDKF